MILWRLTFSGIQRIFTCRQLNIFSRLNIKAKLQKQHIKDKLPSLCSAVRQFLFSHCYQMIVLSNVRLAFTGSFFTAFAHWVNSVYKSQCRWPGTDREISRKPNTLSPQQQKSTLFGTCSDLDITQYLLQIRWEELYISTVGSRFWKERKKKNNLFQSKVLLVYLKVYWLNNRK